MWDGYLTAAEQEVPLPEDDYGLYRICVHNGGAFLCWSCHHGVTAGMG